MIDTHAHMGQWGDWKSDVAEFAGYLEKKGFEKAIVSDLSGNGITCAAEEIECNRRALDSIGPYADRLRLLYFLHPSADTPAADTRRLFDTGAFLGFKVYPRTAGRTLLDPSYERCYDLAEEFNAPVCSHTEDDGFCDVRFAAEAAVKRPGVSFVAVHAGFRTSHEEAFRAAAEIPNFYVDTTLLHIGDVLRGVSVCGREKMLFGSDALAIDEGMCERYDGLYERIALRFGEQAAKAVFDQNAKRLFPWREMRI